MGSAACCPVSTKTADGSRVDLRQTDARLHQPRPVFGRPPASGRAGARHDDEERQLWTFEIENAALVVEIEPGRGDGRIVLRGAHVRYVAGTQTSCESF